MPSVTAAFSSFSCSLRDFLGELASYKNPALQWNLMQFENVIGQVATKKHLTELVLHNRLSHALLFLGKEGGGSLPLALAFAQYIVCASAKSSQGAGAPLFGEAVSSSVAESQVDACGICPSCVKAQQFVHPDIHFSFPGYSKKVGNATGEW